MKKIIFFLSIVLMLHALIPAQGQIKKLNSKN